MLSLASERRERLASLRNPDDQTVQDGIPDMPSTALEDKVIRTTIQGARKLGPVELKAK